MLRSSAIRHSPQLPLSALSQGRSDTERTRQATVTEVREQSIGELARHGEISIAFQVDSVFEVRLQEQGLGGVQFTERPVEAPWFKDYDTNDGGPERWSERFDVSRWGLLGAYQGDRRIGGAVIAETRPFCGTFVSISSRAAPAWPPHSSRNQRHGLGDGDARCWRSRPSRTTFLPAASTHAWAARSPLLIASPTTNCLTRCS